MQAEHKSPTESIFRMSSQPLLTYRRGGILADLGLCCVPPELIVDVLVKSKLSNGLSPLLYLFRSDADDLYEHVILESISNTEEPSLGGPDHGGELLLLPFALQEMRRCKDDLR